MPQRPEHWGCAFNEERSPFSTRRATCAGEVRHRTAVIDGLRVQYWTCEHHDTEEDR